VANHQGLEDLDRLRRTAPRGRSAPLSSPSQAYRDNYDRIFKREARLEVSCSKCDRSVMDIYDPRICGARDLVERGLVAAFKRHAADFKCDGKMRLVET
jgi:hypothetical protein